MSSSISALQTQVDAMTNSVVRSAAQRLVDRAAASGDPDFINSVGNMFALSAVGRGIPIFYSGTGPNGAQNRDNAIDVRDNVLDGNAYIWLDTPLGQYIQSTVTPSLESQGYIPTGDTSSRSTIFLRKWRPMPQVRRSPA
jgi:hypothetical protein